MSQQTVAASIVASPVDPGTTELKAEWVQHRFQSMRIIRSAEPGSEAGSSVITEEWWSLDLPAEVPVEVFTDAVTKLHQRAA
jgi:hypothetical protein